MHNTLLKEFLNSCSDNLKSKIKNPKWLGLSVFAFVLVVTGTVAQAQQPGKVPRIGYLHGGSKLDFSDEAVVQSLRALGYVIGKNIILEYRYADGKLDRFPDLAADLVRNKMDIIVAVSESGARAAKNATKTIPIVMVGVGRDPAEAGLIESLARPGGNITGLTLIAVEVAGRRLELFKEAIPKAVHLAVLYDPANPGTVAEAKEVQTAGRPLGLNVQSWGVGNADGFETLFAGFNKERPDGIYVPGGPLMNTNHKRIADSALKNRIPSVFVRSDAVDGGGLMSYGVNYGAHYGRVAYFVDKILKGTKPTDLPVERPAKFELVINLRTAKALNLTIPQSVLYRADKVIK